MVKAINFDFFNYLNEVQEAIAGAIKDEEMELEPEEKRIYIQLLGSMEYFVTKLDKLYVENKTDKVKVKPKAIIKILDLNSIYNPDFKYSVDFDIEKYGAHIPATDLRGVGEAIKSIKSMYNMDYDLEVKDLRSSTIKNDK